VYQTSEDGSLLTVTHESRRGSANKRKWSQKEALWLGQQLQTTRLGALRFSEHIDSMNIKKTYILTAILRWI